MVYYREKMVDRDLKRASLKTSNGLHGYTTAPNVGNLGFLRIVPKLHYSPDNSILVPRKSRSED